MSKIIKKYLFIFFITGLLFFPKPLFAEKIAENSAKISLKKEPQNQKNLIFYQKKELAIKNVLEKYNSPLKGEYKTFVDVCKKYNLDCYLLPSIAGLESTFGKFIFPSSYNPFGWGGGYIIFSSWKEAINTVGQKLRENYIDKWGLKTVEEIGPVYSESPTWSQRVNFFINEFKKEEKKYLLQTEDFPVKL